MRVPEIELLWSEGCPSTERAAGGLANALPARCQPGGCACLRGKTTPDVFVLDAGGVLRYRGAPDSDCDDPNQRAVWLRNALDAVLSGELPRRAETKPVGCSIKWMG